MKFKELSKDIKSEYVNTFRIYPSDCEIVLDFALIDNANTKLQAEFEGREKAEEIIMSTKARVILTPQLAMQLYSVLDSMLNPKRQEENKSEENK